MKTVQMTLDDELVDTVDNLVKQLHTTRSAFTRAALKDAIKKFEIRRMEEYHKKGYDTHPSDPSEFSDWENEQVWGQ